ncbi:uncharacterized protein LOC117168121 [Belonocnema kinseyi]|uniref:uncharacterized protein LOC117168121 n=1 Tax=Belonocnema kinseyi TaxID=2817044 RepID=UPI00143CD7C8|nr:uncharacterized protein LOC117168121 [Belonocnema kinseyi]
MIIIKVVFGLVFLIPITISLVRINIWHDKLKQLCFSRGDTLYKDLMFHQQNLSSHLSSFYLKNLEYSNKKYECQSDINSKLKLELFVDAVQLCMDEQDRLQKGQKEIFIVQLLEVVCKIYVLGGGKIHDPHCANITRPKLSACRQTFHEFEMILLPLIYNTGECSETRRLLDCLESQISDCNDITRNEFQASNNVTFYSLYGCSHQKENFDASNMEEKVAYQNRDFEIEPMIRFNLTTTESSEILEESLNVELVTETQKIVRFNFTKTELKKKCNQKGDILSRDVESSFAEFLSVKAEKQFSIALAVKSHSLKNEEELRTVLNENCFNDVDIKNSMEKMFNAVEQCFQGEYRFDELGKEKLLTKTIDKFCSGLDITASLIPSDQECFHDFATFFKLASCGRNDSVEQVFFDSLPLLFASSPEECSNLYRIQNCKLEVHEQCKDSTKNWLQEQFNQERRFAGCEDTMYNITFVR